VPPVLADPPETAQAPPAPSAPPAPTESPASAAHCDQCGAALAPGQEWCLQCGKGVPGSLAAATHSRRTMGIVIAAVALLVAGAAAAAYAAWGKSSHHPRATRSLTALAPASTPPAGTPGAGALPGAATPPSSAPGLGGLAKPPKIPLKQATPTVTSTPHKATAPASTGTTTPTNTTTTPTKTTTTPTKTTTTPTTTGAPSAKLPPALELDTNAASTYNPYSYAASSFGDPSLATDGDTTTGWTAQVEPSVAPKMAEGVAVDLRSARHVADVKVFTPTLGMTVQIYGANGPALPGSITDAAWVPLSHALVIQKNSTTIKLRAATRSFRFFVLWISLAPQSAIGTRAAPGHVTVDEFELFPPRK
jgi:hypothetical protein